MLRDIEIGSIQLWHGTIASIPARWYLCDGSNGTPDLRDRFIVGAGSSYTPGDKAGVSSHTHDFTGNGHAHGIPFDTGIEVGIGFNAATTTDPITGTTNANNNLPTYYALAYIMYKGV